MVNALRSIFVLVLVAGCSNEAINGTVAGNSFDANSASTIDTSVSGIIAVTISSTGNICAEQQATMQTPDSSTLTITLAHAIGGDFSVGTYTIVQDASQLLGGQLLAAATFSRLAVNCSNSLSSGDSTVTSGTVSVTSISLVEGGGVQGSFSFVVGSQADQVTGSFNAPFCTIPSGNAQAVCG